VQEQHFHTIATPPKQVAYLHPHAQHYMRQALPTLSQN
jgi:hypothetical protein